MHIGAKYGFICKKGVYHGSCGQAKDSKGGVKAVETKSLDGFHEIVIGWQLI